MVEIARFVDRLHMGGQWAYLWVRPGLRTTWYRVGQPLPDPGNRARDVYFGVHPSTQVPCTNARGERAAPHSVRARAAHIAAANCLFSEFDAHGSPGDKHALLDRICSLDPAPSVIVDSGGGYHCYWLLADTFLIPAEADRERIDTVQKAWVSHVGGDESAKDLARMLRLPGTQNHKYAPPRPVHWVRCDLDRAFSLDELASRVRRALCPRSARLRTRASVPRPGLDAVPEAARALERLAGWRCDTYQSWIEVGMALSELGEVGLALWDLWSRQSAKYEPGVCAAKWPTFAPAAGLTLSSLHYWAEEDDPVPRERVLSS